VLRSRYCGSDSSHNCYVVMVNVPVGDCVVPIAVTVTTAAGDVERVVTVMVPLMALTIVMELGGLLNTVELSTGCPCESSAL
jgi:hypothetical protein